MRLSFVDRPMRLSFRIDREAAAWERATTMDDAQRATTYGREALIGFVAGLRSQLPFAMLAFAANRGDFAQHATGPLRYLRSRWALAGCGAAAVGEMIADKLPFTPSRIDPGPLAGRIAFGALAGAALARGARSPLLPGVVLGASGAAAGSFAGYCARRALDHATGWPDPIWGGVEDAVAVSLGLTAVEC